MKYRMMPIALGMKIASKTQRTTRMPRRFASAAMYPRTRMYTNIATAANKPPIRNGIGGTLDSSAEDITTPQKIQKIAGTAMHRIVAITHAVRGMIFVSSFNRLTRPSLPADGYSASARPHQR